MIVAGVKAAVPARHAGPQLSGQQHQRRLPGASAHHVRRETQNRSFHRRFALPESAAGTPAAAAAAAALPQSVAPATLQLPFSPDRRCVEDIQLPSLAQCHHYINLTNGIEAMPRLQRLGLPYRFLRLPSTRCEQQQFEALMNDLDADLLMRLAMGQCCLVYDFGSRNKKRGAPRAIWYGLEFIRFALRMVWFQEQEPAYLRGFSVASTFERHVKAFGDSTKKKLRYYKRYLPSEGLPRIHLYGIYSATTNDGDKVLYAALVEHCEHRGTATEIAAPAAGSGDQEQQTGASASAALQPLAGSGKLERQVQQVAQAAAARLQALSVERQQALLQGGDIHQAAEALLGMRLFLGGIAHQQYNRWVQRTGFVPPGSKPATVEL